MQLSRLSVAFIGSLTFSLSAALTAQAATPLTSGRANDFAVAPGAAVPIEFKAQPNARCTIGPAGRRGFTAFADGRGNVRVYARPGRGAAPVLALTARCAARGAETSVPLQLRAVAGAPRLAAARLPRPATLYGPPGFNPALASPAELKRFGYPPRPDVAHEAAYKAWLRAMLTPTTRVSSAGVLRPDRVHGPARNARASGALLAGRSRKNGTSNNWSGFVDFGSTGQFGAVIGEWYVPSVSADSSHIPAYSSLWDGIDGWGSGDVLQNGTEQDVTASFLWWTFYQYDAWYEFYPDGGETQFSNFSVNPGDEIYSESYPCYDGSGNLYGCYYIENLTQGESTTAYEQSPNPGLYQASSAEWVLERPTVGGSLGSLPDYGNAYMTDMFVLDNFSGTWQTYTGEPNDAITMYNGGDELSTVSGLDNLSSYFTWINYL